MKFINSEIEKERLKKAQLKLFEDDIENFFLMLKNDKLRGAYLFLFDSLERLIDLWSIENKRVKPENRKEREEIVFKFFPPTFFSKFKSFYIERRAGLYEDVVFIERKDLRSLHKFLMKVIKDLKIKIRPDLMEKLKSIFNR